MGYLQEYGTIIEVFNDAPTVVHPSQQAQNKRPLYHIVAYACIQDPGRIQKLDLFGFPDSELEFL